MFFLTFTFMATTLYYVPL